MNAITAGERDGKIIQGCSMAIPSGRVSQEFINDKTLVLTTTNGTKLLHMALESGASQVVTGSFPNLSAICFSAFKQNQ